VKKQHKWTISQAVCLARLRCGDALCKQYDEESGARYFFRSNGTTVPKPSAEVLIRHAPLTGQRDALFNDDAQTFVLMP